MSSIFFKGETIISNKVKNHGKGNTCCLGIKSHNFGYSLCLFNSNLHNLIYKPIFDKVWHNIIFHYKENY